MTKYNIKAIPTMYNGVQFRSRLEATWAAFFDLCEWDWDYEPIDLDGWIPDFIIHGGIDIYVEVKPFIKLEDFNDVIDKIYKTKIEEHILLLGLSPFIDDYSDCIGWCNESYQDNIPVLDFEPAVFNDHIKRNSHFTYRYDFHNILQGWWQRLNNKYHPYLGDSDRDPSDPMPLWKKAKNEVQWIKKQGG